MYFIENYKDNIRFNRQCDEIHNFLQVIADTGYNEHFHWGRFNWMMSHSYLDVEMLSKNALFRNENGQLVGAVLYDTSYDDRWYLLHATSDKILLRQMMEYVTQNDAETATIKANADDTTLCSLLEAAGFEKKYSESVLEIDSSRNLSFQLPQGFHLNTVGEEIDNRQWQMVIHRGFDHEGIPEEPSEDVAKAQEHLNIPEYITVFAIKNGEYVAHCGVWYSNGDTAYIEPVVTVPEYRGIGLGKAVVYEAVNRAKEQGAKRAIVLSDQAFYLHLGMKKSSEVGTWVKSL